VEALDLLSLEADADLVSFAAEPESDLESDLDSDLESDLEPDSEPESLPDELLLDA
jgi:hypothetical protein